MNNIYSYKKYMANMTAKEVEKILNMYINDNESVEEIEKNFEKLNQNFSILYKFVLAYNSYSNKPHNYNFSEEELTMMEAHILLDIVDNPKITVTELATKWKKTTSAISQTIKKLIKKEYVCREISPINAKFFYLYPTEKAKKFTLYHKHYDNIDIVKTIKKLRKTCSAEEIAAFHNVMDEFTKILEANKK